MFRFSRPLIAVLVAGCGLVTQTTVATLAGSGVATSEDRPIAEVKGVHLHNIGTLTVKQGDKESLTVKGDDNVVPLVESEVKGGILTIRLKSGTNVSTKIPLEYMVEVKELGELALHGAAHSKASNLQSKQLNISLTGACHATLAGKCDQMTLSATGACHVHAFDLSAKSANVTVTGACRADVHADEKLDANATGASTICYSGNATVTPKTVGASSIKKK